jgi:hypothetical protein
VVGLEVRHADRADPAVGQQLLERAPGVDVLVALRGRPVDQVQVEILEPQQVK